MKDNPNFKIAVSGAADISHCCPKIKEIALEIGKEIAKKGGDTAKKARKDIEQKTGKSAISTKNAKSLQNKKIKRIQ